MNVPEGWEGVHLSIAGLSGVSLNRYAKMLPHRLNLSSSRSVYIDGNIFLRRDPTAAVSAVLDRHQFAVMKHPERDCAYDDIKATLRLGFVWPRAARQAIHLLRENGVSSHAGLFECNIIVRKTSPEVTTLCETWWDMWQLGYPRDQALLIAAAHKTGVYPSMLPFEPVRDIDNHLFGMSPHSNFRNRRSRLPRRLASEILLYREWTKP